MNIKAGIAELIGGTPLVELEQIEKKYGLEARLLAKLEYFNPAGSAKDRVALEMIEDAQARGLLAEGGTVIEPTSGNTGIGIAALCARQGYRAIIIMPDTMSMERRLLMKAYGAELVLTPGALGMQGAVDKAEELKRQIPGSIIAGQFENPANPNAHYKTTGPELWRDTDGCIDAFVAGIGTGGTISGTGRYLKEKKKDIRIIGVEPAESPLISQGRAGSHGIQGIGSNFVPGNYDAGVVDEIMPIATADSYAYALQLAACEGLLCGISSGAALCAAVQLAQMEQYRGKTIIALMPDTGERYLSSPMFE